MYGTVCLPSLRTTCTCTSRYTNSKAISALRSFACFIDRMSEYHIPPTVTPEKSAVVRFRKRKVVVHASRSLKTRTKPKKHYCAERLETGDCYCFKAGLSQRCQSCSKEINGNKDYQGLRCGDCVMKTENGWVHIECPGDEVRGLEAIKQDYNEVSYGANGTIDNIESSTTRTYQPRRLLTNDEYQPRTCMSGETSEDDVKLPPSKVARVEDHEDGHDYYTSEKKTEEQLKILNYKPELGEIICINALAGCGKTSTIALLCDRIRKESPHRSILYLVYNSKNQNEAMQSGKMPKDRMEIRTTHAFVLRHYFGVENMHSVQPVNDYDLEDIIEAVDLRTDFQRIFEDIHQMIPRAEIEKRLNTVTGFIRRTVAKFQSSDDNRIQADHVFWRAYNSSGKRSKWRKNLTAQHYVTWATQFFDEVRARCKRVKEGGRGQVISHDGYLKVAQLEQLEVTHDVIMVDEAQDMSPCQAALFWRNYQSERRVTYLIGDRYQQIYRFRGAGDSFNMASQALLFKQFDLRGSFRFGKNIAQVGSCILQIEGNDGLYGRACFDGVVEERDRIDKGIVLCRSNNGIYKYLESHQPTRWCNLDGTTKPPHSPKAWEKSLEQFLTDLSEDEEVSHQPSFKYKDETFLTIEDVREYANDEGDSVLIRSLSFLCYLKDRNIAYDSFIENVRGSFDALQENEHPDDYDGIVLGTVHKAKGLEFNTVLIFDDFQFDQIIHAAQDKSMRFDEANILYVAVTRAKRNLYLSKGAVGFFDRLQILQKKMGIEVPSIGSSRSLEKMRKSWLGKWKAFKDLCPPIESMSDIPWPPNWDGSNGNCLALDRDMPDTDRRSFINKIRLFLHPDKFLPKYRDAMVHPESGLESQVLRRLNEIMQNCATSARNNYPGFEAEE